MRLVFAGTPEVAVPSLDALLGSSHDVVAVVTRPDAPAGRGRRLFPSPVAERAAAAGVEVLKPERVRDPDFLQRLRDLAPDCCPVVAYGALVPPVALEVPKQGWVNLHFSLLPAWRGAAPVQHAVLHGDTITGASTFLLEAGLDTGPVFGTVTEEIGATDTSGDLLGRLAASGAGLLLATLDAIEAGTARPERQPADGVSLAPKLRVEDARVAWTEPAFAVDRRVRACTPAPGAWTTFRGDRVRLGPVRPMSDSVPQTDAQGADPELTQLAPGEIAVDRFGARVGTATGPVLLGEVRPAGKRAMPAVDWLRGVRPEPGERLA